MSQLSPSAPALSSRLPRELVEELLHLARSGGADFAEVFGEYSIHTSFQLEEKKLRSSSYQVMQCRAGSARSTASR